MTLDDFRKAGNPEMPANALSGGLASALDYPTLDPAADLAAGENHAFWFFDNEGRYSLLGCHIQGGGSVGAGSVVTGAYQPFPDWRTRRIVFPIAGPGDELFVDFAIGGGAEPDGYALGGWEFRCVEPFKHWTGRYRGTPCLTSRAETMSGIIDLSGPRVAVEIDLDFDMALPPWIQGDFVEESSEKQWGQFVIGTPRYEQLYHATGAIRVTGRDEYRFTGTGLRTHRYGKRVATKLVGSSWLSALFPSGRAFGSQQFLNGEGVCGYKEAFVTDAAGCFFAVRATRVPWLERLDCIGRRIEFAYEGPHGPGLIEGDVLKAAYNYGIGIDRNPGALDFCHMMTRFRWDGEETVGMVELGMLVERLQA